MNPIRGEGDLRIGLKYDDGVLDSGALVRMLAEKKRRQTEMEARKRVSFLFAIRQKLRLSD